MGCSKNLILMMVVLVLGVSMVEETSAQQAVPDCASNLVPCANFLNSTKPPETCCKPLRETVEKQRKCLCNLYEDPSLLQSFGINITQALELTKHCGVSTDTSLCKATATATAPAPTVTPSPPGVPGGGENGASKMAWIGLSSLVLFWASIMAY